MNSHRNRARSAALALGVAALAIAGCATTAEAAAATTSTQITAADAREGAEQHPELLKQFGGALTGPQAQYIEQVGRNIAVQSGLSNARDAFTVTLLDSSVNNAFAIPGGYIYTTRQLVGLMNNEAELAGVLGHEVGHVAARHSQKRQSKATQNGLLGLLGQIVGAVVGGGFGDLISRGAQYGSQILTLKYSRSQENQADALAVRYLGRAGYDPHAMATVLQSLAMQNALDAQLQGRDANQTPEWASTHPDPASRVKTVSALAGSATGITNRDTFLTRIDGLMYGDDPHQGVIDGSKFTQPDLRFTFTAPQGFYMVNGTDAVSINGNGNSGQAQLKGGAYNGDLDSYVRQSFANLSQQQQIAPQSIEHTTVNGIPAAYGMARVNTGNGQVDVVVFAYEFSRNQAFHFVTLSQPNGSGTFNPMFSSMRRITPAEAALVVPRVIDVVTVGSRDTVQSLASRMAYPDEQEARFRVLNGQTSSQSVVPGQKVKLVVRAR